MFRKKAALYVMMAAMLSLTPNIAPAESLSVQSGTVEGPVINCWKCLLGAAVMLPSTGPIGLMDTWVITCLIQCASEPQIQQS